MFSPSKETFSRQTLAEAFSTAVLIYFGDMRQYQQKFIAAHSPADIRCPRIFFEDRGKFFNT